ncbi:MAG: MATE family efflux transporter [Gemmiger sp.]|uniref:MATE family efflux transporter n=1 Tax=Gemmiger sp. TaxID=2049027 RepID=UPI002E78E80D|nr:MATE family efflux transporter [Gemmiger sp.]MEE0800579.1 MATE family efflux transporter [Gemmiger sp.]
MTDTAVRNELFETTPLPRAVASLAVPTILSSLVMVLYNLADTWFVGMLNDPVQNAAVTLAAPVLLAFNAVNNLFGVGSSSLMSRALGCHDYDTVQRASTFGFWCSVAGGVLISAVCLIFNGPLLILLGADAQTSAATEGYLWWTVCLGAVPAILNVVLAYLVRAEGASLHASIGTMSGCFLNMILDPIFIMPWGLGMGAAGAGCATFLSNCVACLYFFVLLVVRRGKTLVCVDPRRFRLQKGIARQIFGVGLPACIQNLLNVTGMTILNNFAAAYGANAVAALGIVQKVNMVPMQVALGFSQGIMPLVSYNYASGNHRRMKKAITGSLILAEALLIVVTIAYEVFADGLIRLFMQNPDIVEIGTRLLREFCLEQPLMVMDFMTVGVFQALGMGRNALVFAIMRKIVLEIPALFVFDKLYPLYGLGYAQPFAEAVLAVASVVMLARIYRRLNGQPQHLH